MVMKKPAANTGPEPKLRHFRIRASVTYDVERWVYARVEEEAMNLANDASSDENVISQEGFIIRDIEDITDEE